MSTTLQTTETPAAGTQAAGARYTLTAQALH
jgi:hypothetical protein